MVGSARYRPAAALGVLLAIGAACAVPVPPSGGPEDSTPPSLVESEPATGSVRVRPERVRIRFDEYVDQRAAATAVSVTPEPVRPPEIRYGGKHVDVIFREPLRDSTTYIVTLGTGFRDAHGVALAAPLTIAFSTGDEIDAGSLSGRVLEAADGRPAAEADVFAWSLDGPGPPDSLTAEPAYRTQTDREGRFRFEHLAERPFFVAALRDANRNRRPDAGEALALPPVASLVADSAGTAPERPWLLSTRDDAPPELRRTAARSASRVALLFSEPVRLADRSPASWSVSDSAGVRRAAARVVDVDPVDPLTVLLLTEPLSPGGWTVRADSAVADSAGNVLSSLEAGFMAVPVADTARSRFTSFAGDSLGTGTPGIRVLAPWARAGVRFSAPIPPDTVRAALGVADTSGAAVPFDVSALDGAVFDVTPERVPPGGYVVRVRPVGAPADTTFEALFAPAGDDRLGELAGVVAPPDAAWVLELLPATPRSEPVRRLVPGADGTFRFARLPGGRRYTLRLIADEDGDGRWTPGRLAPFRPAESVAWFTDLPAVRARWETVLPDTLRIGTASGGVPTPRP